MRFLRYTIIFALLITLGIVAVFLGYQELVLFQARNHLMNEITSITKNNAARDYYQYCESLGAQTPDEAGRIVSTQLRFISSTEYVIEALCYLYEFAPYEIRTGSLPLFATKKPGGSGVVLVGEGSWKIELQAIPTEVTAIFEEIDSPKIANILFRTKSIFFEDGRLATALTYEPDSIVPATVCAGYGYTCCDPVQSLGLGDQRPATDCRDDCFASCQQRPMVLSFNAEPNYDRYQRSIQTNSEESILFSFVIGTLLPEQSVVSIDFGDGSNWSGTALETTSSHAYYCGQTQCQYRATIGVLDAYGTESAQTAATEITVIVGQ